MKFFRPPNFFKLFEQFQKLVAFLLPIFRNVDGSWRVTSKLRGSTLIQVARRRLKVFQRFSASLVRVGDVQGVSRRHAVRGKKVPHMGELLGGVEKLETVYHVMASTTATAMLLIPYLAWPVPYTRPGIWYQVWYQYQVAYCYL